jgi:hypothetical protein
MILRIWPPRLIVPIVAIFAASLLLLGSPEAFAQTVGPDEAVNIRGIPPPQIRLTEAQKAAIYNAVLQQRVRSSAMIPVAVGAPVSPALELADLPDQTGSNALPSTDLKYAMVEDDLVVVDPVRMRVIEVIRRAKP